MRHLMFRVALTYLLWPVLFFGALALTSLGAHEDGMSLVWFNGVYLGLAIAIIALERLLPHERVWLDDDRQTLANLGHTVLNKGLVMVAVVVTASVGLASAVQPPSGSTTGLWPGGWPVPAQIVLGLVIAEAGLYTAHRLAHAVPLLWRFHSVHHSVTRLWVINTGRFHFVDTFLSIVMSQPLLYLCGAPAEVFLWTGAVTAFIGVLTHCNIEMRFGVVSYVFNTPGLHRWHHSMDKSEGDRNFGENLMLFDLALGTFYNPDRRPPVRIGITEPMPASFVGQLLEPFRSER